MLLYVLFLLTPFLVVVVVDIVDVVVVYFVVAFQYVFGKSGEFVFQENSALSAKIKLELII